MKIGIDLGTTRSAVAILEADSAELLPNQFGDRLTPSVVYYDPDGDTKVGKNAVDKRVADPDRVVENAKRHMGDDHEFDIDGVNPTPVNVSAEVLREMRSIAEDHVDDIDGVEITVPAYFTVDQKADTREAAEKAGFDEIDLLHEPTAAAISYGYDRDKQETLFVYDFGGGTLDISIIDVDGNDFKTLATAGDNDLGGHDFTEEISNLLAEEIKQQDGVDPLENGDTRENLRTVSEDAKKNLSGDTKVEISAPLMGIVDGTNVGIQSRVMKRDEFENEVSDLLNDAMAPVDEALDKARLDVDDIDRVLLVGGSSYIPAVQNRLEDKFGFAPDKISDPDWAVAQGAALVASQDLDSTAEYACPVCGEEFVRIMKFRSHLKEHDEDGVDEETYACPVDGCDETFDTDGERDNHVAAEHDIEAGGGITKDKILGQSLGTDIKGGRMDILLPHDTVLSEGGAKATERYRPVSDTATEMTIQVYQGENTADISENTQLADWKISGIPKDFDNPIVEVRFDIDKDGVLSVDAELVNVNDEIDKDELGQIDVQGGRSVDDADDGSEKRAAGDD